MANITRFILSGDLRNETVIEQNVQITQLVNFIDIAQPMYIKRILGVAQYDDLTSAIDAISGLTNFTALTTSYQALVNEIKKPLCYCTWYEAFPYTHYRQSNKGITLRSSIENDTTPAKLNELNFLRTNVYNWAQFYLEEFKQFLRNNRTSYSLWREDIFYIKDYLSGSTVDNVKYFNGIQFDSSIPYDRNDKNNIRRFLAPGDI